MELKVTTQSQGDHAIMSVAGEIDLYTAPRLHTELMSALGQSMPLRLVVEAIVDRGGVVQGDGARRPVHPAPLVVTTAPNVWHRIRTSRRGLHDSQ